MPGIPGAILQRIAREIRREARRLIVRHETKGRLLAEERARRVKRSTSPHPVAPLTRPARWSLDAGFDPYLTAARAERIAHSIQGALNARTYRPRHPVAFEVPKASGGLRIVNIYQVADSAISKMFFENLQRKNLPVMSSRSYAYRRDVSGQDAIQYVKTELRGKKRVYIAEYDFSKYFDTISHDHIRRVLRDRFLITEVEKSAIDRFLETGPCPIDAYDPADGPRRNKGIPQGTSISLFLANVAAWELDQELEGQGVRFVRYADDTLIWSNDYARIAAAADLLHSHADIMGVAVNAAKSPGIHLLVPDGADGEISTAHSVDYLGHRVSTESVYLKPDAEQRIKHRIDQLIFNTLLREPLLGSQHPGRLQSGIDRDYVTLISRLRRYLYGDLSEKALRIYQTRGAPLRRFKGVMSAYPLLDNEVALAELDRWILDRLWLATRKRGKILKAAGLDPLPTPHGLNRERLRNLAARSSRGERIELAVPSVRRISSVIADAAARHGTGAIAQPPADAY